MSRMYEKQWWCGDCHHSHVIKLFSAGELAEPQKARFFHEGDDAYRLRKYTVCGSCGCNMPPHSDIDIIIAEGEWKEICLDCFRKV